MQTAPGAAGAPQKARDRCLACFCCSHGMAPGRAPGSPCTWQCPVPSTVACFSSYPTAIRDLNTTGLFQGKAGERAAQRHPRLTAAPADPLRSRVKSAARKPALGAARDSCNLIENAAQNSQFCSTSLILPERRPDWCVTTDCAC